jgi:hypothetical protein
MATTTVSKTQLGSTRWPSRLEPAQALVLSAAMAAAALAGFVAASAGASGVLVYAGALAVVPLFWLRIETLIGLWLVFALADPALPRVGGLSFSDVMLVIAFAKLALRHGKLPRLPWQVATVISLAWLAELILMTFGHSVTGENSRFLVTLAGLTAAVYLVWSSVKPTTWVRWLAIASAVAAAVAVGQYLVYHLTGVVLFPKAQNLFFVRTGISNVFKATGLGIDPNFLGMWMVPGFGIGLIGVLRAKRRALYGSLVVLCALGIIATGSRGALISAAIGTAIVAILEASSPSRQLDARILRVLALLLIAGITAPFVVTVIARAIARYPVTVHTRTEQVPVVLHDAVSGNWTGKGYQAQLPQAAAIGAPFVRSENVVHNTLLQALFEAGWIGFLVPLLMLITGLRISLRLIRRPCATEAAMLGAAFILLAVNLQTLGAYAFRPLWFLWALLFAVGESATAHTSARVGSPTSSLRTRRSSARETGEGILARS